MGGLKSLYTDDVDLSVRSKESCAFDVQISLQLKADSKTAPDHQLCHFLSFFTES